MTMPISGNSSLVPRRREERSHEEQEEVVGGEELRDDRVFAGYAPPGAEWQARVRRLPEDHGPLPTVPVSVDAGPGSSNGVTVVKDGGNKLVLRIEAEVTVMGDMPREGVRVETITILRRPENGGGSK